MKVFLGTTVMVFVLTMFMMTFSLISCTEIEADGRKAREEASRAYKKEDVRCRIKIPDRLKEQVQKEIIEFVRAANPKSDEEPEDYMEKAYSIMLRIYGEPIWGINVWLGKGALVTCIFIPYEKANKKQKAIIDAVRGLDLKPQEVKDADRQ